MDVPLPSIDLAHVVLHTDDRVSQADADASGSDAAAWKLLEQRIMPGEALILCSTDSECSPSCWQLSAPLCNALGFEAAAGKVQGDASCLAGPCLFALHSLTHPCPIRKWLPRWAAGLRMQLP